MPLFKQSIDFQTISYRKKPYNRIHLDDIMDQSKNSTWSGAHTNNQRSNNHKLNITEIESTFFMLLLPIEERISTYEEKYKSCMESQTQLSSWIKNIKQKGPPSPLTEDYSFPIKSRTSENSLSSVSTKFKSKRYLAQETAETAPTVRSSISTFLKKATGSISTSYRQAPNSKQQKAFSSSPAPSASYHKLFSFHRFSLASKTKSQQNTPSCSNSKKELSNKKSSIRIYPENSISRAYGTTKKFSSRLLGKKPIPCFEEPTNKKLTRNESIDSGIKISCSNSLFQPFEKPDSKSTDDANQNQHQTVPSRLTTAKLPALQSTHSSIDTFDDDSLPPLGSFSSTDSIRLIVPPSHSSTIPPLPARLKPESIEIGEESFLLKRARKQQGLNSFSSNEHQKYQNSLLTTSPLSIAPILSHNAP